MSLAGVKQIVYLQNDFTAYMIGNIMFNLANRIPVRDAQGTCRRARRFRSRDRRSVSTNSRCSTMPTSSS